MSNDATLTGAEITTYRRAMVPLFLSYTLDLLVALLGVILLFNELQDGDFIFVAILSVLLVITARTLTRRTRDVQITLQGPIVRVLTDGLQVNVQPQQRSLRWSEVAGATVHKIGSFGRIDIKLKNEAQPLQVFFLERPDELGQQIQDLRQA